MIRTSAFEFRISKDFAEFRSCGGLKTKGLNVRWGPYLTSWTFFALVMVQFLPMRAFLSTMVLEILEPAPMPTGICAHRHPIQTIHPSVALQNPRSHPRAHF
eukprot:589946-Prorocentrum_minimum.AAC.1